jgi:hypothetical protein
MSLDNPGLRERQQQRMTRSARRLEGARLRTAREEVDNIVNMDYGTFSTTNPGLEEFDSLDTLEVEYVLDRSGRTKTLIPNTASKAAIQRIKDFSEGKIVSPEGKGPYTKLNELKSIFDPEVEKYSKQHPGKNLYKYLETGLGSDTLTDYD